jgi:hypothetical protein
LIVDAGGWFSSKEVLVPAGLARIVGDDVFFDSLTKSQVEAMEAYDHDYQYSYKEQYEKDRQTFTADTLPAEERVDIADHSYDTSNTKCLMGVFSIKLKRIRRYVLDTLKFFLEIFLLAN